MVGSRIYNKLSCGLRLVPTRVFNFALGVAISVALLNALWLVAYASLPGAKVVTVSSQGSRELWDISIMLICRRVAIALIIGAVSLWSRKPLGLIFSGLSLLWVTVEYVRWYILSYSESFWITSWRDFPPIPIPIIGKLYGGTWWNLVVLLIVVLLFIWEIRIVVGALVRSSHNQQREYP